MEENRNLVERELFDLATDSMMLYGVNINLFRAIPQIYDGLKPIHRRILYSMWEKHRDNLVKVATSEGEVLHYSPHGDQGLTGVYARMAQPFSNNVPLLFPDGNCGTPTSGDDYAAERYWDVKISEFTKEVLFKEFDGKVNMMPNYDRSTDEPIYLPAKFPIILLNGVTGIAYTMSCDIPPYNLSEVADATLKLLDNPNAKIRLIPDSPTGCDVMVRDDTTFVFQSCFDVDNMNYTITIRNTPYTKYIRDIQKDVWAIQDSTNPIPELLTCDDESELIEDKLALVFRCKPCNLYTVVNKLFRRVPGLRSVVSTKNMIVVDNVYRTHEYDIRQILLGWIKIRLVEKRNWYLRDLVSKTQKYNILEGKAFMLHPKNIDKTLDIYKKSKRAEIPLKLVQAYPKKVSTSQANYMKDAHMYEITIDEYEATLKEMEDLDNKIKELKIIVSDPENIKNAIADDIKQIKAKFGVPRRSKIINLDNTERNSVGVVQILTDGSVVFSETENPDHLSSDVTPVSGDQVCLIDDTAQFLWVNTNKVPQGKPVTMTSIGKTMMGRCVSVVSNMSNNILILTNRGRVKYMPIDRIPSNASKKPLIPLEVDEVVVSILELRDESEDILIYTSDGMGKRVKTSELNKVMSVDSIGQFLIKDVNNVSGMFCVNNKKPLLLYVTVLGRTRVNKASLLKEGKKFGEMKSIIRLSPQDDLIAVYCVDPSQTVALQHADSRISTINISSLPVSTMSTPPTREKHVPGVKVVRAVIS